MRRPSNWQKRKQPTFVRRWEDPLASRFAIRRKKQPTFVRRWEGAIEIWKQPAQIHE